MHRLPHAERYFQTATLYCAGRLNPSFNTKKREGECPLLSCVWCLEFWQFSYGGDEASLEHQVHPLLLQTARG
jgi:hypothetical protein